MTFLASLSNSTVWYFTRETCDGGVERFTRRSIQIRRSMKHMRFMAKVSYVIQHFGVAGHHCPLQEKRNLSFPMLHDGPLYHPNEKRRRLTLSPPSFRLDGFVFWFCFESYFHVPSHFLFLPRHVCNSWKKEVTQVLTDTSWWATCGRSSSDKRTSHFCCLFFFLFFSLALFFFWPGKGIDILNILLLHLTKWVV